MLEIVENIQSFVAVAFAGLIWTIQLAHYPSFNFVKREKFVEFEKFHTFRILIIVAPFMFLELVCSLLYLYLTSFSFESVIILVIVASLWFVTFYWSVPCHKKLLKGKDPVVINILVNTNWIRTILWSMKAILLYFIF